MGHLVGKDIFRRLGDKIDGMEMRPPWNARLHAILKELYSADEAEREEQRVGAGTVRAFGVPLA